MLFRTFAAITTVGIMAGAGAPAALAQGPGPNTSSAPASTAAAATAAPDDSGLLREPGLITRAISFAEHRLDTPGGPRDGFYPELGSMITGSGWISAGPGYRQRLRDGHISIDASAAISWNLYKTAQASFELPRLAGDKLAVGAQVIYQDLVRVNYYGLGEHSLEADRSGYRLHGSDTLAYATVKPNRILSVTGRFGWLPKVNVEGMTGRAASFPNTLAIFSDSTAPGLTEQAAFLHGDVAIAADTRDNQGHPTSGGFYRAGVASYTDRDAGQFSFRRYEVEGTQFVPIVREKWVIALRAWEVFSETSNGNLVPFYLMPSLGGGSTLRSYTDFRFHDRNMVVLNAESRWALFTHVDVAVFADAGRVASQASDVNFKPLKQSYGAGVRVHTRTATIGRLDVAHGSEGWRVVFTMKDAFRHSRLSGGRSTVIPFVP